MKTEPANAAATTVAATTAAGMGGGEANADAPTSSSTTMVRGRVKSESKPASYNQLWTSDEQRRLEELLEEFPPERVEARRYRKIADRLGTKTLQQVSPPTLDLSHIYYCKHSDY